MQRYTIAQLIDLRKGDRFYFPGKKDEVWEKINDVGTSVAVNTLNAYGEFTYRHPVVKRGTLQVYFLRHTQFEPGDECLIEELNIGDIIACVGSPVKWEITEKGKDRISLICTTHREMTFTLPKGSSVKLLLKQQMKGGVR